MKEKGPRKREGELPSSFRYDFDAITVGSGRSAEPYIMAFHYKSDNVAGKTLGTLFGFFEVEIHDEDAAYIVNFLASVAKKEYFANPRREVEDSFETTLHKVNVALAEIAKEGNVSWLGHLHGILGAVSNGVVHFTATGDGVLSLARDNTFRPISDGLAETLSEPHPLKTFTEVASGELMEGDVLLALSPAVWTLFTPDDLKKNLARLGQSGFEQFLHTALINELSVAGAVVVSISSELLPLPISKKEAALKHASVSLDNVWSGQPFERAQAAKLKALEGTPSATPSVDTRGEKEYTDKKTGHIYLQGDDGESAGVEQAWKTTLALTLRSLTRGWQNQGESWRRFSRRSRKNIGLWWYGISTTTGTVSRALGRRSRSLLRRLREAREARQLGKLETLQNEAPREVLPEPVVAPIPTPPSPSRLSLIRSRFERLSTPTIPSWLEKTTELTPISVTKTKINFPAWPLDAIKTKFVTWGKHSFTWLRSTLSTLKGVSLTFWERQTKRGKAIILGVVLLGFTASLGFFYYHDRSTLWDTPAPVVVNTETTPPVTKTIGADESLAISLSEAKLLLSLSSDETVVHLDTLDGIPYLVTSKRIINLNSKVSTPLASTARLAAMMDDLNGIFLIDTTGAVSLFTPSNEKFITNTLPLPIGVRIDAIDCYLTYLYVLDRASGIIYRFPRTEGGFGEPVTWSKETLSIQGATPMMIAESIALINTNNQPVLYERGRKSSVSFTEPVAKVSSTSMAFDPKTGDLFVLDPGAKRLIRWSNTGTLVAQYFHDSLREVQALVITPDNTLVVIHADNVESFQLP